MRHKHRIFDGLSSWYKDGYDYLARNNPNVPHEIILNHLLQIAAPLVAEQAGVDYAAAQRAGFSDDAIVKRIIEQDGIGTGPDGSAIEIGESRIQLEADIERADAEADAEVRGMRDDGNELTTPFPVDGTSARELHQQRMERQSSLAGPNEREIARENQTEMLRQAAEDSLANLAQFSPDDIADSLPSANEWRP